MNEHWIENLRNQLGDYEVHDVPEHLWEDIQSALPSVEDTSTPVSPILKLSRHWRKACAVVLILASIAAAVFMLNDNEYAPSSHHVAYTVKDTVLLPSKTTSELSPAVKDKVSVPAQLTSSVSRTSVMLTIMPTVNTHAIHVLDTLQTSELTDDTIAAEVQENLMAETNPSEESSYIIVETHSKVKMPKVKTPRVKHHHDLALAIYGSGMLAASGHTDIGYYDGIPPYNSPNGSEQTDNADSTHIMPDDIFNDPNGNNAKIRQHRIGETEHVNRTKHHRPLSVGLQLGIPLSKRFSVNTGITYTFLHSEFDNGNTSAYSHADTRFHYVGVPLELNSRIYGNDFIALCLGIGGKADFVVASKRITQNIQHDKVVSSKAFSLSDGPNHYALTLSPNVQVKIIEGLNLYITPSAQYNIPIYTDYETYFSTHKWMFDLSVGLRWSFKK